MAFKLIRSHKVYLSSVFRDPNEKPYSTTFVVPNDTIYLDDVSTQRMKVSLLTFGLTANWTEITDQNNIVAFATAGGVTTITIPKGSYPFYNLAAYITNSQNFIRCKWDMPSNTFVFTNTTNTNMLIEFLNDSYKVLGFSASDYGLSGTTITSTSPIVPQQNTELYVKLMSVLLGAENLSLDNYSDGVLKPSNLLSIIPITAQPFRTMFYDNAIYGVESGVYISNEKLQQICIDITDKYGKPATFMPDWTASLLIQIFSIEDPDLEDMKASLTQINETLTRLLTLKFVR